MKKSPGTVIGDRPFTLPCNQGKSPEGRTGMIISSGNIQMASSRRYQREESAQRDATIWGSGGIMSASSYTGFRASDEFSSEKGMDGYEKSSSGSFSDYLGLYRSMGVGSASKTQASAVSDAVNEIRKQAMDFLLRILFGENWERYKNRNTAAAVDGFSSFVQGNGGRVVTGNFISEQETTSFETKGTVLTEDGREIEFNVKALMSRSFVSSTVTEINYGAALKDPLVINLNGNVASVSDQTFYFDIDADGHKDAVKMLSEGSGFLALDKNGDGTINDGSELFGALSGNGFEDLREYDSDNNGWIDEADEAFASLMVWQVGRDGNRSLTAIGEAGIGAIYLGYADTEYSLNSAYTNETNGVIRKSGVFLYENGKTGIMQQIDLATE